MTTDQSSSLEEKQKPLSEDIRLLGNLLGDIIREQQGDAIFDLVEDVRINAIARRNGDADAAQQLADIIANTDLNAKRTLTKAFGNYLQLINLAEDQQRIRTLRRREIQRGVSESVRHAITTMHEKGISGAEMRDLLEQVRVRLTLTAHPSEAKRQEVLIKLRDIADMLAAREGGRLLPREDRRVVDDIIRRIEQLWQIRPTRATRATVADEVQFGLYFFTNVIMDIVVQVYEELRHCLDTFYPDEDWSELPPVLRFASWMGADRDGNPNVTPRDDAPSRA